MNNVYTLVACFYQENTDAELILSQDSVEKYLRKMAWQGADDAALKEIWSILSLMVQSVEQLDFYSLAALTPYDYQEIFYRYAQENELVQLDEASVGHILAIAEAFFAYLVKFAGEEDYRPQLRQAKQALYEDGKFFLPPRRPADEFYRSLEHMLEISPETLVQLNQLLDSLLARIRDYYHEDAFKEDMERATLMYAGPEHDKASENQAFWYGFWDFFLFDYHLLASDEVPLRHYYRQNRDGLTLSEQDVLRDLLRSEFTVFSIVSVDEDFVTCQNLFTEEYMDLPLPEMASPMFENCLLYGHIHSCGVMLLNYITSISASDKLKKRMKELVLRQYEWFKFQQPEASLKSFFHREAGAVRHTMQILSGFAQLNMLPIRSTPHPLPKNKPLADVYQHEELLLHHYGRQFGYSKFELTLLLKLFEDYLDVQSAAVPQEQLPAIMMAALLKYTQINGLDVPLDLELFKHLGINMDDIGIHMDLMRDKLGCYLFDPRYLSEEGFIRALYY